MKWHLEKKKIVDLKPHPKNPRQFTKDGMKDLEKSLKSLGMAQPININMDGTILSGHARVHKLKEMGITDVDVYVPDIELTDKQQEEILIRMNANTAGEWDTERLANEWEIDDLKDWGLTIVPDIKVKGLVDEDEVPEVENPITRKGDIWLLGDHRVMCGDSLLTTDIEKLLNGKKADMVFTDPPYNTGMSSKSNNGSTRLNHMFNDNFTPEEWNEFIQGFCVILNYLVMKENTGAYICLDWRRNHELIPVIKKNFDLSNVIVWDKVVHGLGSDYKYTYELINVCKKGKPELDTHQGDREYSDVWHIQRKMGKNKDHATAKPVELIERCLRHASKPNSLCVDIFLGSGSTLIACEKTNRICYGMELDEHYCDVIVNRWQDYTGKEAILESTKETYNSLKAVV